MRLKHTLLTFFCDLLILYTLFVVYMPLDVTFIEIITSVCVLCPVYLFTRSDKTVHVADYEIDMLAIVSACIICLNQISGRF